ncbi:MAG: response regulator transcription factor [Leadbetterella sp.]
MVQEGSPKYYAELINIWNTSEFIEDEVDLDLKYEELSKTVGEFAQLNNQFINIYNLKKQKVLFMSENYIKVLGYTYSQEQYKKWAIFYWMRDLPLSQSYFFLQLSNFYRKTIQPILNNSEGVKSLTWYMHNFQIKPPGIQKKHLGLSCTALEIDKTGKLEIILIMNNDISPYIKDNDLFWFDITVNGNRTFSYNNVDKKFVEKSILSDREKEILNMIREGQDTKAIAELLDLSPLTVEKHRKNMLDRTGTKDISMLIQICNMGRLI